MRIILLITDNRNYSIYLKRLEESLPGFVNWYGTTHTRYYQYNITRDHSEVLYLYCSKILMLSNTNINR